LFTPLNTIFRSVGWKIFIRLTQRNGAESIEFLKVSYDSFILLQLILYEKYTDSQVLFHFGLEQAICLNSSELSKSRRLVRRAAVVFPFPIADGSERTLVTP